MQIEVTECNFRLEFMPLPDGSSIPGVTITVLYVLKDENGDVIPYHLPPVSRWWRLDELPQEIASALDTLIQTLKPGEAEIQENLKRTTLPFHHAPLERAIKERKEGKKPTVKPFKIAGPPTGIPKGQYEGAEHQA